MSKESIKMVVDAREPDEVFTEVDSHDEVDDWQISMMESGDLRVGSIGFERKTLSDYANSMISDGQRQLEKQVAKMQEQYEHCYILLDADDEYHPGNLNKTDDLQYSGVRGTSFRGSMAKLTANGVPVIPCSNIYYLVDIAVRISRKHVEESELKYLNKGPVDADQPVTLRMYGCLPGVGLETANLLYERFPNLAGLANASEEELKGIEGVGDKTAERIIETVRKTDVERKTP